MENRSVSTARKSTQKKRLGDDDSVFSLPEPGGASASAGVTPANSSLLVNDISSLFAIQGIDVDAERAGAIQQGYDILDTLDALKIDVLSGLLSRQKMIHLANIVSSQRAAIDDPALINLLDHINLRARVELAKFERYQR